MKWHGSIFVLLIQAKKLNSQKKLSYKAFTNKHSTDKENMLSGIEFVISVKLQSRKEVLSVYQNKSGYSECFSLHRFVLNHSFTFVGFCTVVALCITFKKLN